MTAEYNKSDMERYQLYHLVIETLLYNYNIDDLRGNPIWEIAAHNLDEIASDQCLPDINAVISAIEREIDALTLDDAIDPDQPIPYTLADGDSDSDDDSPANFRQFPHHQPGDRGTWN